VGQHPNSPIGTLQFKSFKNIKHIPFFSILPLRGDNQVAVAFFGFFILNSVLFSNYKKRNMKNTLLILILAVPLLGLSQNSSYQISSYLKEGNKAPNVHHLGEAWLSSLLQSDPDFSYNITLATFAANSTLDWHKHGTPQIIIIVDGEGFYQEKGKDPIILKKGDLIKCEKNTEHWHSSTAKSQVSYLAIYGNEPTIWTEKLTQEYYDSVAEMLEN
jgi:quercetin dioxygenase-like cupin family protein